MTRRRVGRTAAVSLAVAAAAAIALMTGGDHRHAVDPGRGVSLPVYGPIHGSALPPARFVTLPPLPAR